MSTPYQGSDRQFGFFHCNDCKNSWQSGNSWANEGQQCQSCKKMIYPFKQQPLEHTNQSGSSAQHPQHLCGKCKKLGYPCTQRYF